MANIQNIIKDFNLSPNHKRILKNVYWAVVGKSVNIICGLLVGIFVARYLGPQQYGLMSYVISYVMLFSILATFGLDSIEIRELSKGLTRKETILGTAFIIRLLLAFITILLILGTLLIFESDSFTFLTVVIYSLSLIFSSLNVIRNYFTSIVKNEYVVKTEISRTIIGAGIKTLLLINKCSLIWFIIANTFDFLLIGSGFIYAYHKKVGPILKWHFENSVARLLLKESFPLLLSGAAIVIYQRIDQVMIRNMIDAKAVGQFAIASGITDFVIFIPSVIAQTITPILVQLHQKDIGVYNFRKQQFMDIMVWSSVIIAIIISLSAHFIILLLYGKEYSKAIPVLQIMAWKAVFVALFVGSGQIIIIENIHKYAAIRNILGCVVSVLLNLILIPIWGIIGSAVATIVTMTFSGYFSHLFIRPYRYLFDIQTTAILSGWKNILKQEFKYIR